MNTTIKENVEAVREKIVAAARKAGRNPDDVTLMAVSKTKPLELAMQAAEVSGIILGENYVQELTEKYDKAPELSWHFIGHLQKNKVKFVVPRAKMIHSLDSIALAEKINSESEKLGVVAQCLLEINAGDEISKFGLTIDETQYIIEEIKKYKNVCIRGLMTVAPYVENPEQNRRLFSDMRELSERCKKDCPTMDTLSMGMSGDFEVAVEEGATIVRVGTSIFGARNYNK